MLNRKKRKKRGSRVLDCIPNHLWLQYHGYSCFKSRSIDMPPSSCVTNKPAASWRTASTMPRHSAQVGVLLMLIGFLLIVVSATLVVAVTMIWLKRSTWSRKFVSFSVKVMQYSEWNQYFRDPEGVTLWSLRTWYRDYSTKSVFIFKYSYCHLNRFVAITGKKRRIYCIFTVCCLGSRSPNPHPRHLTLISASTI